MVKFCLLVLRNGPLGIQGSSQTRKKKIRMILNCVGGNLPAQVKELASNRKREVTSSGMRGKLALLRADKNR